MRSAKLLSKCSLSPRFGANRVSATCVLVALAAVTLSGCTVYEARRSVAPPVHVPSSFANRPTAHPSAVEALTPAALPDRWWEELGDPELSDFVDRVLSESLDLQAAWARLAGARARIDVAGAGESPQVGASFAPSASYLTDFESGRFMESKQLPLTISIDHELDLWGRVRSQRNAAELDAAAARLDVERTAQALVGQIAGAWLDRAEQRALKALLAGQIETADAFVEVVRLRFQTGQAGAADVLQQQQQVAALRAQLPLIDARIALADHRLALLAGQAPGAELPSGGDLLPPLPATPQVGVPADLLRRRPDIAAAESRYADLTAHFSLFWCTVQGCEKSFL